ncbi:conjugative transposon protein TraM [Rhodocytophaga aerolata]|uniref:Conjugative transposon protein TraM n=1 Tax=Rhodocytophaga aerolata TaxID=455078 RepID=A0ABT8RCM7_9BACT|nr:conjugative transposon protein TraM [Rhodocytophaga aerolata]MDO1449840.1 conjugative transposon protein TraM [Rhodocytophaga aerolata]
MKKEQVLNILKKHYLLLGLTLLAILLLIGLGIKSAFGPRLSTPIASIAPADTLLSAQVSSTLERYLEELKPKPIYQAAKEEIMAMDFSKPYRPKPIDSIRQVDSIQLVDRVKSVKADRKDLVTVAATRQETSSSSRPATRTTAFVIKGKDTNKIKDPLTGTLPAGDGFYTLKRAGATKEGATMGGATTRQANTLQADTRQASTLQADATTANARLGDATSVPATSVPATPSKLVRAVIEGDHSLSIGAPLRLRLTGQALWSGEVFPANTLCYGRLTGGSNGRVTIHITRMGNTPLSLSVFDQDLKEGIRYGLQQPESEALTETSHQALNEVFSSLPYGGVAGGLARLGRNLFGKIGKGKQGRIHLADGYQVWVGNP